MTRSRDVTALIFNAPYYDLISMANFNLMLNKSRHDNTIWVEGMHIVAKAKLDAVSALNKSRYSTMS